MTERCSTCGQKLLPQRELRVGDLVVHRKYRSSSRYRVSGFNPNYPELIHLDYASTGQMATINGRIEDYVLAEPEAAG